MLHHAIRSVSTRPPSQSHVHERYRHVRLVIRVDGDDSAEPRCRPARAAAAGGDEGTTMTKVSANRPIRTRLYGIVFAAGALSFATAVQASDAARSLADRFASPPTEEPAAAPVVQPKTTPEPTADKTPSNSHVGPLYAPPGKSYEAELLERARREHHQRQQSRPADRKATQESEDPHARVDAILERLEKRINEAERKNAQNARPVPTPNTPAAKVSSDERPEAAPSTPEARERLSGNAVFGEDRTTGTPAALPTAAPVTHPAPGVETGSLDNAPEWHNRQIERVTVLLAIEPGRRGIRRLGKTGDPILCLGETCYVSRGAEDRARRMTRRRAFGTVNTLGNRAGACRNSLACVFRDVRLQGGKATIQPIDLRIMRHDRRETTRVTADRTCRIVDKRLTCARPVVSETYTAWIVPEDLAVEAGVRILETALLKSVRYAQPREAAAKQTRP